MKRHKTKHQGFTSKATDWELVYSREFSTVSEARVLERRIKKRGAKRYLESEME